MNRSVWNGHVTAPRTRKSQKPVPVTPLLRKLFELHWREEGSPKSGLIFSARNGKPLRLDNLLRRVIKPKLEAAGIRWRGWHAFRRGLATTLGSNQVMPKLTQQFLRHADVETTQNLYEKALDPDVVKVAKLLDRLCTRGAPELAKIGSAHTIN